MASLLEYVRAGARFAIRFRGYPQPVFRLRGTAIVAMSKLDLVALLDKSFSKESLLWDQWIVLGSRYTFFCWLEFPNVLGTVRSSSSLSFQGFFTAVIPLLALLDERLSKKSLLSLSRSAKQVLRVPDLALL